MKDKDKIRSNIESIMLECPNCHSTIPLKELRCKECGFLFKKLKIG